MTYTLDAYCGLYCGACPALLGTMAGTEAKPCHGCKSGKLDPQRHCATCGIKNCALQYGYEFCYKCTGLESCDLIQKFMADEKWPYHQEVMKNMEFIQREGLSRRLVDQAERWRCGNCGANPSWWDEFCPRCGEVVKSFRAGI